MSDNSKIEWTNTTWNPVVGCTKIGTGCKNCYAERMAVRLSGPEMSPHIYNPVIVRAKSAPGGGAWNGKVNLLHDRLDQPLHWRKPRRIFVCSMSDLFHKAVPFEFIDEIFVRMIFAQRHTYQILTKRYKRALEYFNDERMTNFSDGSSLNRPYEWPLPNAQVIFSASNQDEVNEAWKYLEPLPAAVKGLSLEPLLGAVRLPPSALRSLQWVIVGGESGPGARPMHPQWVRDIRDQCVARGVPFFFKQWGAWLPFIDSVDRYGSTWGCTAYNRAIKRCAKAHGASILLDDRPEGWSGLMLRDGCAVDDGLMIGRVGKKKAGRILDGRTWDQYPASTICENNQ